MKIYIAARFIEKEEVSRLYKLLSQKGYEITTDWTLHKSIKPYEENQELARRYTTEDIEGVRDCDVFILLSDESGTGMHVELGAAIFSNIKFRKPKIYVVGKYKSNHMFYFHPSVNRRETIGEVLEEIRELDN